MFNICKRRIWGRRGGACYYLYEYQILRYTGEGLPRILESIKHVKERELITVSIYDIIRFRISHSSLDEAYKCGTAGTYGPRPNAFQYNEPLSSYYTHRGTHIVKYIHANERTDNYLWGVENPYFGGVSEWLESTINLTDAFNEDLFRTVLYFQRQGIDYSGDFNSRDIFDFIYIWLRVIDVGGGSIGEGGGGGGNYN